jgi:UDP-galactopyranose mutase
MKYDYLIVGAGFAGCVLAERLASQCNKRILLIDRRPYIGGNAHDSLNEYGIRIHHFGPHIFHTNSKRVYSYLSQFTEWRQYEHHVLSSVNKMLVPMPINRTTVNMLLGHSFSTERELELFLLNERIAFPEIHNSEEFVLSRVGSRLFELLYHGYTKKQWGKEPRELSPGVCGRLPVRLNTDDRYFEDRYQAIPLHGYSQMFSSMVAHQNIHIELEVSFKDIPEQNYDQLIYTGPIDEYFGFMYGSLPYRSLRFEFETYQAENVQVVGQVNFPNEHDYTRITEFKHITGQKHAYTTIAKEFPIENGEPYYPIPQEESSALYELYRTAAEKLFKVHFAGRLATYQYFNMDQVVAHALVKFELITHQTP